MRIRRSSGALALAAAAGAALAQPAAQPITVQVALEEDGVPANGLYDFNIPVFTSPTSTGYYGEIVLEDVEVRDGLVTLELDPEDFTGPYLEHLFNGNERWLEIRVRPGHVTGNAFTFQWLKPRIRVGSVPYAGMAAKLPNVTTAAGRLGIGTTDPVAPLHVAGSTAGMAWIDSSSPAGTWIQLANASHGGNVISLISTGEQNSEGPGQLLIQSGTGGVLARFSDALIRFDREVHVHEPITIIGADLAEKFDVAGAVEPQPGHLVCIDPDNPGRLEVSTEPYSRRVAGIISGAGGIRPAVHLHQPGTAADGDLPVAMSGRVYVYADADAGGAIEPGDLLTTSATPGHAMRATDREAMHGAVVGKAMTRLESGRGLVLVLVNLQ